MLGVRELMVLKFAPLQEHITIHLLDRVLEATEAAAAPLAVVRRAVHLLDKAAETAEAAEGHTTVYILDKTVDATPWTVR